MLSWAGVRELRDGGVEIGGHSHTHPQLDAVGIGRAREEVQRSTTVLADKLGERARSFAYPHGYSSGRVRALVREAGYECACGVGNAFSHPGDDLYRLSRLLVRATTTPGQVSAWIRGEGAPLGGRERVATRGWRLYRRAAVRAGVVPPVQL
jgi:peptidoglycan/xylan/chitin deacetylase (PgdA/CDA1 family)